MGPEVMDLINWHQSAIDRATGLSAIARGASMSRRETSGTTDATQEAAFVRIKNILQNFEEAFRQVAYQAGTMYSENVIEPRVIPLVGPQGDNDSYMALGPRHFQQPVVLPNGKVEDVPLFFQAWVEAGSSLPMSRQSRAAEAMSLYFAGLVDDEAVLEATDMPNKSDILKRVAAKKASGQMGESTNPRSR